MAVSPRRIAAIALAALAGAGIALVVVRNAAVMALAERSPETASAFWPSHPSAAIALASREIAVAAGLRRDIDPAVFARLDGAAKRAPLEPQPFVVAAIRSQLAGNGEHAERALVAARARDPRFLPARYFLASERLRRGDVTGLEEVAALARLSPDGVRNIAPFLATFAQQERAWPSLRAMFRDNPGVRNTVLWTLAEDPANLRPLLALGGTYNPAQAPWLKRMIQTLVEKQRFAEARALWERTSGIAPGRAPALFDPGFRDSSTLPPFNWSLTSSSVGLAERRSGQLHVIFYGQEEGALARQLLTLGPGRYRLEAPAKSGQRTDSLRWTLRCAGKEPVVELSRTPVGVGAFAFTVPSACPAQWLELTGSVSDVGRQNDATIGPLRLSRVPA